MSRRGTPASWVWREDELVLSVVGSIDELVVDDLRLAIFDASDRYARSLVIELSEVDFLPSSAIGVLASATRQAAENGAVVTLHTRAGSLTDQVLTISGIPHERRPT